MHADRPAALTVSMTTSAAGAADTPISERISRLALDHYSNVLPPKGKPQPGREWTCYAAIVAVAAATALPACRPATTSSASAWGHDGDAPSDVDMWVISAATGSKCVAITAAAEALPCRPCTCVCASSSSSSSSRSGARTGGDHPSGLCKHAIRGAVLHDSHAEVLARRGLVRVLWAEVAAMLLASGEGTDGDGADDEIMQQSPALFGNGYRPLLQRKRRTDDGSTEHGKKAAAAAAAAPAFSDGSIGPLFELRPGISLHIYITDSPCGDASIYPIALRYCPPTLQNQDTPQKRSANGSLDGKNGSDKRPKFEGARTPASASAELSFTGAKIVVPNKEQQQQLGALLACGDGPTNAPAEADDANQGKTTIVAREGQQILGALRTKSGRSNLPSHLRSTSMSCSDKLCRWSVLGMQGSLLSRYLPDPIVPASIVVGRDPRCEEEADGQRLALERAICRRAEAAQSCLSAGGEGATDDPLSALPLPRVFIASDVFEQGKARSEKAEVDERATVSKNADDNNDHQGTKKSGKKSLAPCGFCINWQLTCNGIDKESKRRSNKESQMQAIEMVIGAKGIKQGKKPKKPEDVMKVMSRLCRYELHVKNASRCSHIAGKHTSIGAIRGLNGSDKKLMYQEAKALSICTDRARRKSLCVSDDQSPLSAWVSSSKDGDFAYE